MAKGGGTTRSSSSRSPQGISSGGTSSGGGSGSGANARSASASNWTANGTLTRSQAQSAESEVRSLLNNSRIESVYYDSHGELASNGSWETLNVVLETGKAYGDGYTRRTRLFADGENYVERRNSRRTISDDRVSEDSDRTIKILRDWARKRNYKGNILITQQFD